MSLAQLSVRVAAASFTFVVSVTAAAQSEPPDDAPPAEADAPAEPEAPPAAEPAPPEPSKPVAPAATTSLLRVSPSLRVVRVDGRPLRVEGGAVIVPCGRHRIATRGSSPPHVDIPCGADVSLVALESAAREAMKGERATRHAAVVRTPGVLTGRAHAGAGARWLFGAPGFGAEVAASLGVRIRAIDVLADAGVFIGATSGGLALRQFRIGPSADGEVVERLRIGFGMSVGGTQVVRATKGRALNAFSLGVRGFTTFDLWKGVEHASVYLLAQAGVESATTLSPEDNRASGVPAAMIVSATLGLGARF